MIRFIHAALVTFFASCWASHLAAETCTEYNSLGVPAKSEQDLNSSQITSAQIGMTRKAVALEAARIAGIGVTPLSSKFSRIRTDKTKLGEFAGGSSTLIRYACFRSPHRQFEAVVEKQVEAVIESDNKYES